LGVAIFSKLWQQNKTPKSYENPENISYAHKHEKYPKGCYHKKNKKQNSQSTSANWKTTFIFVVFQIS